MLTFDMVKAHGNNTAAYCARTLVRSGLLRTVRLSLVEHEMVSCKCLTLGCTSFGNDDFPRWYCEVPNGTLRAYAFLTAKMLVSLELGVYRS